MKILQTLIFVVFLSTLGWSQTPNLSQWTGHYAGILFLEYPDGRLDSLEIEFEFDSIGVHTWSHKFTFKSKKYGDMEKNYQLVWNDSLSTENHFILDEKDGILIDEVLLNNTFYSHYSVVGNDFATILRKEADHLYYEIVCSSPKAGIKSQSTELDDKGEAFKVNSSLVYTVQYARLYRQ
jgi:hypothetical protein